MSKSKFIKFHHPNQTYQSKVSLIQIQISRSGSPEDSISDLYWWYLSSLALAAQLCVLEMEITHDLIHKTRSPRPLERFSVLYRHMVPSSKHINLPTYMAETQYISRLVRLEFGKLNWMLMIGLGSGVFHDVSTVCHQTLIRAAKAAKVTKNKNLSMEWNGIISSDHPGDFSITISVYRSLFEDVTFNLWNPVIQIHPDTQTHTLDFLSWGKMVVPLGWYPKFNRKFNRSTPPFLEPFLGIYQ